MLKFLKSISWDSLFKDSKLCSLSRRHTVSFKYFYNFFCLKIGEPKKTLLLTQLRAANLSFFFYCQVLALGMPIIPPQELGFLGSLTACMRSSSLTFMPAYVPCCMIPTKRFIHSYLTPATLPDIFAWLWFLRTYKVGKDLWSHLLQFLHALRNVFLNNIQALY